MSKIYTKKQSIRKTFGPKIKRKKSKRRKTNNKKYGGRKSNKRKTNKRKTKRDEIGDELYMAALVAAAVNFGDSTDTTSDTISDTSDIS